MSRRRLLKIICIILSVILFIEVSTVTLLARSQNRYVRNMNLGNKYLLAEDYDQAVIAFSKAIEVDPMSEEAYIGRGDAYFELGEFEKARADYEKAAEISGDYSILHRKFPEPTATPIPAMTPRPTATPVPPATQAPTATPEPTATPVPRTNYDLYKPILQKVYDDQDGMGDAFGTQYIPYGVYDWDGDGVRELFVRTGRAGMGYEWHVYTIRGDTTEEICYLSGFHRVISICPTGGIYLVFQQIVVRVERLTYDGQNVNSEDLGHVADEVIPDEYSNFLELANVTDYSLLE